MDKNEFGKDFQWGVTISAFQNEGHAFDDGKGLSIWDVFVADKNQLNTEDEIGHATNFYETYEDDIRLARSLGINVFRFSISWSRLLPDGIGPVNKKGVEFYHKVIDTCLKFNIQPYVTLYHWDLPNVLETQGGWTNPMIIQWFEEYVELCIQSFGNKVTHWIIVNEPMTFVGLGYYMGYHAPGKKGLRSFAKEASNVVHAVSNASHVIRRLQPKAKIGVSISCSLVQPSNQLFHNKRAAKRIDALLNRFFIEPWLGLGYPLDALPWLRLLQEFTIKNPALLKADLDFIGLQYYFRVVAKHSLLPPVLFATEVHPTKRSASLNAMNLDAYPKGLFKMIKKFSKYDAINQLIITESGVCYDDQLKDGIINDDKRLNYHKSMLKQVRKAIHKGHPVNGYFIWTLMDNYEWSEGFHPRFGVFYNDHSSQTRHIKKSGEWFQKFLTDRKQK